MVLLLDLLGLVLVSSAVNNEYRPIPPLEEQERSQSAIFKYYTNRKGSQVVEVSSPENRCHIFENGHANWILETRKGLIATLNYIQFQILLQKCQLDPTQERKGHMMQKVNNVGGGDGFKDETDLNRNMIEAMWNDSRPTALPPQFYPNEFFINVTDVSHFMDSDEENSTAGGIPLIFPGTKWCGRGDIASSEDDLGLYADTDRCCREHDHCPENIPAKKSKYGLTNDGGYTRSHCECDEKFLQCLENDHSLSSLTSFKIANIYFNILKPTCFARRHPISSCQSRRLSGECIAFQYDFQRSSTWQFFPAQPYIARPARALFSLISSSTDVPRFLPTAIPLPDSALNNVPLPDIGRIPNLEIPNAQIPSLPNVPSFRDFGGNGLQNFPLQQ